MTFEELEKEAKKWCKSKNLTSSNVGYFTADYCEQSYIAAAVPREKRITELEKENAELKAKYDTRLRENTGLKIHNAYVEKKLAEAKYIIRELLDFDFLPYIDIKIQAEKFIKE